MRKSVGLGVWMIEIQAAIDKDTHIFVVDKCRPPKLDDQLGYNYLKL